MNDFHFQDEKLIPLWNKLKNEERLTRKDGLLLCETDDIVSLGKMAAALQERMNGDAVYFALHQTINPSKRCPPSHLFGSFPLEEDQSGGDDLSATEILSMIRPDIREVHINGSPKLQASWSYYLEIIRLLKEHFPLMEMRMLTAADVDYFSRQFSTPITEILRQLKDAGVDTMSDKSEEALSCRMGSLFFEGQILSQTLINIHKAAHRLGIRSRATLFYNQREPFEDLMHALLRLREAQDETGGFLAVMPLPFTPGVTGASCRLEFAPSLDNLRAIAISRLMLDNFPHIQSCWGMMTDEAASASLNYGADDLEGTVCGEGFAFDNAAVSPMSLGKERLLTIIRNAGKIPVERDSRYRPLDVQAENVVGKIAYLNSVPFYNYFEKGVFKLLPAAPRYLGMLSAKGKIIAAPFSLMDYLAQEDELELMDYCIASFDKVRSIMFFSRFPWPELEGKNIGIIDDTATSVHLLRVLLENKYAVHAHLTRMQGASCDYRSFDAVLLIGDEALKSNKSGLSGFDMVFDLATEWYEWQKIPFVFAVWAVRKTLSPQLKNKLSAALLEALIREEKAPSLFNILHGKRIGLTKAETATYLEGIKYRLGETERAAIEVFRRLAIPAMDCT